MPDAVNAIAYTRGVDINLLAKGEDSILQYETTSSASTPEMLGGNRNIYWQEMPDNDDFILSIYDLIGDESRLPTAKNEIALVVDEYNRIDEAFFEKLGIYSEAEMYNHNDFIGKSMLKVITNNDFYTEDEHGIFVPAKTSVYDDLYNSDSAIELTITGILRIKKDVGGSFFSEGLIYTTALTDHIVVDAQKSAIAIAQEASEIDVVLNTPFQNERAKEQALISLGAITSPTGIDIYPNDFASKDEVKAYLDEYNLEKEQENQVVYNDLAETITSMVGTILSTVTYVLIGFAAISLLVSTIMIGIITYVSVIERTKEIGILRSVGARKKDVSRVFNAETLIVGFVAGLLGIGITYLLTLIAGLIPARMAAKKDPVVALRTEYEKNQPSLIQKVDFF